MKSEQEFKFAVELERLRAGQTLNSELFDSVIQFGITAVKVSTLVNGGAAIALLAFLGNLGSDSFESSTATRFALALTFFGSGVFVGGLCAAIAYLVQLRYLEVYGRVGQVNAASKLRQTIEYGTAALFLVSFALFGLGVWQSCEAIFLSYSINSPEIPAVLESSIPPPTSD